MEKENEYLKNLMEMEDLVIDSISSFVSFETCGFVILLLKYNNILTYEK